jgi:hypothetical protein
MGVDWVAVTVKKCRGRKERVVTTLTPIEGYSERMVSVVVDRSGASTGWWSADSGVGG